jgi:hypothetical protein
MCANYKDEAVCNWMVPAHDSHPLCLACRLNRTIPNLNDPENEDRWAKVEAAKRRMVYTLLSLGLPVVDKETDPIHGIAFEFLVDQPGGQRVLTGHDEGVITINVAEAEAHIREKMRKDMGEKYRTLLGHFRHEIGHHYWNVLIRDGTQIESFRRLFGDERLDYAEALRRNYEKPPSNDWDEHYISAYASCHPWEDWAETWGNYLHMIDTLETARDARIILEDAPFRSDEPSLVPDLAAAESFDDLLSAWYPLTFALNNINRGVGYPDVYPFYLSPPVVEKLKFIHQVIHTSVSSPAAPVRDGAPSALATSES